MPSEIQLNVYQEWTDEDRAKGECPVPAGSDVTVWLTSGVAQRDCSPQDWGWGDSADLITAYLVHSVPRKSFVLWYAYEDYDGLWCLFHDKEKAEDWVSKLGGRVVKLVEEME